MGKLERWLPGKGTRPPLSGRSSKTARASSPTTRGGRLRTRPPSSPRRWRRPGSRSCARASPWKAERRRMYDRDVDVPRLTAHFRLVTAEGENAAVPAPIRDAAREVLARTGVPVHQRRPQPLPRRPRQRGPAQRSPERARRGLPDRAPVPGRHAANDHPRQGAAAAPPVRRPRGGQPPDDELRDPAPLHARRAQDRAAGRESGSAWPSG